LTWYNKVEINAAQNVAGLEILMTKLYRVAEVAAVLGLTPMTIYQMIRQGRLSVVRPTGARTIRIRQAELERLVGEDATVQPSQERVAK